MRRHLRWIIPLLAAPLIYVVALLAIHVFPDIDSLDPGAALGWTLATLVLMVVAFIGPVIAIIVAIVGAVRVAREAGITRRNAVPDTDSAAAWAYARDLRARLIAREVPDRVLVWDVVPHRDETFFMDVPADYARFYGQDVSYARSSGFFFGRPAFVLAGLGITAATNAARRSQAQAQAVAQWREQQPSRVLVSNQRLVCNVGGSWLSFYYNSMSAIYPEVENYTLILQFDSAVPLMLHGRGVPAVAVITTLMTHGPDALVGHPSLQKLGGQPGDTVAALS